MTTLTRRDLLFGRRTKSDANSHHADDAGSMDAAEALEALPSDFSPALLKMQARLMGLDVEHMSREETARAVWRALQRQKPAAAPDDDKNDSSA